MKTIRILALSLLVLCLALVFASCGGGSGSETVTGTPLPGSTQPAKPKTEPQPEFSVTYHVNDGRTGTVKKQTEKQLITYFPERDGYEFGGWYCASDLFLPWDPAEKVAADLDLYAEWIELPTIEGQLAAPKLTVKDNVFSWKPVSGANGYRVRVSYQGFTENYIWEDVVYGTSWTFPQDRESDIYMVRICATGNGIDTINSAYSTRQFALRVLSDTNTISLDRATSVLSWDAVENAEYYEVYINGKKVCQQSETAFNMSTYDADKYTVSVHAFKPNWKTSSKEGTINKQTLRVPNVILSVNPDEKSYVVEWDSVKNATEYILNFEGTEVRVKDRTYTFNNNSNVWGDSQIVSFMVNAFSDTGNYYMSTGGPTFTANKLYTLTVENGTNNAINVELQGQFWAPVTVSFNLNGASGSVASQTITKTNALTYPELPERNGYIFRGWFTESECTNVFDFTQTLEQDITLYAGWYKIPSNGTFVEQGTGKTIFDSTSSYHYIYFRSLSGHSLTINYQQDTQSPTSYMYFYDVTADQPVGNDGDNEWSFRNPVPAQTTLSVKAGHVYYVRTHSSSNTTLRFAFYEYGTLDFYPNDGGKAISDFVIHNKSNKKTNTVACNEAITLLESSNNGYTWLGWYNGDAKLTDNLSYTFSMPTENVTYPAKWIACPVTLERNLVEGGSVSGVSGTTVAGKNTTITATTNSGYTWLGWYSGDSKLTDNLSYTFTMPTENVTYTAKWIACPVTLERNIAAGGSVSGVSGTTVAGKNTTITATTNNGYTWLGWYNGDVKLTDNLSYTFTMPTENVTYTAKWTYYTLTTGTNDTSAGSYTVKSAQNTTAGHSVTLSASTNNGYTWLGWYDGDVMLTDDLSYTFTMPTENVTYTAKWEISTYSITYDLGGGTNAQSNPSTYTVLDAVTFAAPTRTGYTFTGWSVSSIPKGSTGNKTVTANWTIITYSIVYNLNGGTNAAGNPTSYTIVTAEDGIALADPTKATSSVLLEYERLENGNYSVTRETTAYTFLGWYTESTYEHKVTTVTYTGADVELYAKWSGNNTTTTTTESAYLRDGDYIYFGEYPQTIKADDVTITDTLDGRGYYLGSDGAYYAKVTASPYGSGYTFSTGASVTSGTVYYFKVEPIKWRILLESDGVALILCDSIIDNRNYYNSTSNRTINGATVYPNNYKESDIRAWLNQQFYETAFSELQRELIVTTTVDNSARSTNPNSNATQWNSGANEYICSNTQDKIFLLSVQEASKLTQIKGNQYYIALFEKKTSDYSRATGAFMNKSENRFGNGCWWLRSPYYSDGYSTRYVDASCNGNYIPGSHLYVIDTFCGVVPALTIQLN